MYFAALWLLHKKHFFFFCITMGNSMYSDCLTIIVNHPEDRDL